VLIAAELEGRSACMRLRLALSARVRGDATDARTPGASTPGRELSRGSRVCACVGCRHCRSRGHRGSPTVQIDGEDLEPAAKRAPTGLG